MQRSFPAGSPFGIPIIVTRSWFLVFAAATLLLGGAVYPAVLHTHSPVAIWLGALATSAIFFGGLFLHEFGHALAARHAHVTVANITMRVSGAATRTSGRYRRLSQAALYVGAGPAVTLLLGVALLGAALLLPGRTPWRLLLAWSALMQLAAAAVNLLPAGTLDGGRLLRAARLVARPRERRLALALVWLGWLLTVALTLLGGALAHTV